MPEKEENKKAQDKPKKKLVLDSSSIIMIVCLLLIFLLTIANKINFLPSWLVWPSLILFLGIMLFVMFKPRKK
jgi:protein-S-isoprenylcysteine O-methyltransferase Ste14